MMVGTEAERQRFLEFVGAYIEKDPEAAARVSDYIQAGLREALNETRQRAADMEALLAISLTSKPRSSSADALFIRSTLEKWRGKTSLDWKWVTEQQRCVGSPARPERAATEKGGKTG